MPRSRSSALSRSNIRLNASSVDLLPSAASYPGTASRIRSALRNWRVDSRQITRLTSRSARRAAMSSKLRPALARRRCDAPTARLVDMTAIVPDGVHRFQPRDAILLRVQTVSLTWQHSGELAALVGGVGCALALV